MEFIHFEVFLVILLANVLPRNESVLYLLKMCSNEVIYQYYRAEFSLKRTSSVSGLYDILYINTKTSPLYYYLRNFNSILAIVIVQLLYLSDFIIWFRVL